MLKITLHDRPKELRLELEGRLAGPWVTELRGCWQTASSTTGRRETVVDLDEVDFVDEQGQALLAEMARAGVRLQAGTPFMVCQVEEIERAAGCVRVEEQPARRSDVLHSPGSKPRHSGAV